MRIKNKYVEEFNKMHPELRRRANFAAARAKKGRSSRRHITREWSRAEIITWALRNKISSKAKLWRWTADPAHREDPSAYMILKMFGTWSKFVKEAFNVDPPTKARLTEETCTYIQKAIVYFKIETLNQYKEMTKRRPDLIPSLYLLKRAFKTWLNAYKSAQLSDANGTFIAYVKLREQLGRPPTLGECHKHKIDLSSFLEVHGSKEVFDEFVYDTVMK